MTQAITGSPSKTHYWTKQVRHYENTLYLFIFLTIQYSLRNRTSETFYLVYRVMAGNRASTDIQFVNKYATYWMKKVGFSEFTSILMMLPLFYGNEHAPQFS